MDGEDLSVYLSGQRLYGDSLDAAELERWWRDEEDAYAALGAGDRERYRYGYHALNRRHGFRHLPDRRYERALGLGSAYGDEFLPIAGQIGQLTVVESCEAFHSDRVHGVPATYVKPASFRIRR